MMNHLLKYPYCLEAGEGCQAIVKKIGLYVQCNKTCKEGTTYRKTCSFSFNIIDIKERIPGGFKKNKPKTFDKIQWYLKILKKHGLTLTKIKKEAVKYNITLNMEYVNEMKKSTKGKKEKKYKKDVSVVSDTSDEDMPIIQRGRGRPKKTNDKNENDLINDIMDNEPEESDDESCYDEDAEIIAEIFNYTGNQEEYKNMSLYIDEHGVVYNNLFEAIGTYHETRNTIIDMCNLY